MNIEKLTQLRDFMAAHPDQIDMGSWVSECGTSACAAGWAVKLDGIDLPPTPPRANSLVIDEATRTARWTTYDNARMEPEEVNIEIYARDLLGLAEYDAEDLFYNTLDYHVVDKLTKLIESA